MPTKQAHRIVVVFPTIAGREQLHCGVGIVADDPIDWLVQQECRRFQLAKLGTRVQFDGLVSANLEVRFLDDRTIDLYPTVLDVLLGITPRTWNVCSELLG